MKWALIVSTAGFLALAPPALADCNQDIGQLDTQFKQAEAQTGQPAATPHQTQTMQGAQPQTGAAGVMPSTGSAPDAASSAHQREALKGAGEASPQEQFATHLQEARQLAQNGDEPGCMAKVEAARKLLGTP